MRRSRPQLFAPTVAVLMFSAACGESPIEDTEDSWESVCIDLDRDGFGLRCVRGSDCDDDNASVHEGCGPCVNEREGCSCDDSAQPVSCKLPASVTESGSLLCSLGTRYCRDGVWTSCEGIETFEVEAPRRLGAHAQALIDPDAGLTACDPCDPACFRIDDPLEPASADGMRNVDAVQGGGITVRSSIPDAGVVDVSDAGAEQCMKGVGDDTDCDGIPDQFDPAVGSKPFETDHDTIFMELGPGESGSSTFDITFFLRTADIYFLLDMTGSMAEERDQLIKDLTAGSFLSDPTGTECADRDFNGSPDNELKNQGIAGNIACVVRNARIGTGWFREIPFQGPDKRGISYADDGLREGDGYGSFVYEHRTDISANVKDSLDALSEFETVGNYNWAEADMQALYSAVTGDELYVGWDRPAVPKRADCPQGTWGYPCFRDEALPIVVMITDAPMMDGPETKDKTLGKECVRSGAFGCSNQQNQSVDYPSEVLSGAHFGSDGTYHPVPGNSNEMFSSAFDLGTVTSSFKTYTGNTRVMRNDVSAERIGCGATFTSDGGADAVFKFRVDKAKNLTLSALGTRFDATMAVIKDDGSLSLPPSVLAEDLNARGNGNDTAALAADLGVFPANVAMTIRGDSQQLGAELPREVVGCFENNSQNQNGQPNNGSDKAPDGFFKFQVANDMRVSFAAKGSDFDAALSLFEGAPGTPRDLTLAGTEDVISSAYDVGDLRGRSVRFTNGNTNSANLRADYPASDFVSAGCGNANGSSVDQVVNFSLSESATVRIETSGDNVDLQANFDHMTALIERPVTGSSAPVSVSGNDIEASAYVIDERTLSTRAVAFSGSTQGLEANYEQGEVGGSAALACGAREGGATSSRDAVFRLDLSTTRTLTFDTAASGFQTYLSLHRGAVDQGSAVNASGNDTQASSTKVPSVSASLGSNKVTVSGNTSGMTNDYGNSTLGCGHASQAAPDAVIHFRLDTAATVTFDTIGSSFDTLLAVYRSSISSTNRLGCNDDIGGAGANRSQSQLSLSLAGGFDYYVVVDGFRRASDSGAYQLNITPSSAPNATLVACDSGSYPKSSQYSELTRTLSAGTYYIVIKGPVPQSAYDYLLRVREAPPAPEMLTCNYEGLGRRRSLIERTLPAGDYSVVVRGRRATDKGNFRLSLSDVSAAPTSLACHNEVRGNSRSFQADLRAKDALGKPITYYLALRGNDRDEGGGGGPYTIQINDGSGEVSALACADDDLNTAPVIRQRFTPGDYYVVLKGKDEDEEGWYQITVGDEALATNGSYDDKRWSEAGGVREKLLEKGVKVINVRSSNDSYAKEQMDTIARTTGALSVTGNPLTFSINSDGSGMGSAVIEAVQGLSESLEMDVGVRLVEAPDNPSPSFTFLAKAIDRPGDLCDPPTNEDKDPAGVLDTHQNCAPGAVPKFEVTFTNPKNQPVPCNGYDKNGVCRGYNMRLELIGDGRYVVDSIPVYIIPRDVQKNPGDPVFEPSATYTQTTSARGCLSAEAPDWQGLRWEATLPPDTSFSVNVCAADTSSELKSCKMRPLATVTSGGTCTQNVQCRERGQVGFCQAARCQYVSGPKCAKDAACGVNGLCVDKRCMWNALPIDPNVALFPTMNGKSFVRLDFELTANQSRSAAPTLHDYRLDYQCAGIE